MAIIIPDKLVKEDNGYGRTINQLMEIFVLKKMKKRKIKEEDFKAAIVEIFNDSREPKVHLNEEAKFVFSYKDKAPNEKGPIQVKLEELKDIKWHDKELDSNSARFFILKWNENYWVLNFDFRYNKAIVKEKIERAKEFLNASKKLNINDFLNVLIYNLWSCAELIIDAKLFLIAQLSQNTTEHKERKKQLRKFRKTSNIFSDEFCDYFLKLSSDKNNARYGGKIKNKFTETFASQIMEVFKKELEDNLCN